MMSIGSMRAQLHCLKAARARVLQANSKDKVIMLCDVVLLLAAGPVHLSKDMYAVMEQSSEFFVSL